MLSLRNANLFFLKKVVIFAYWNWAIELFLDFVILFGVTLPDRLNQNL